MRKRPNDYPKTSVRINNALLEWLKDYSKRTNKSMGSIIKEGLEIIRKQDEQRKVQS